jgi:hypothetical protein
MMNSVYQSEDLKGDRWAGVNSSMQDAYPRSEVELVHHGRPYGCFTAIGKGSWTPLGLHDKIVT